MTRGPECKHDFISTASPLATRIMCHATIMLDSCENMCVKVTGIKATRRTGKVLMGKSLCIM